MMFFTSVNKNKISTKNQQKASFYRMLFFGTKTKEKTCKNTVFKQVLELLVGLEPTTCALRMRCSTN